jgi:hypothetical protein
MIPLLSNPDLLKDLKELVTLEPEGQVKEASGIPPHTKCKNGERRVGYVPRNS